MLEGGGLRGGGGDDNTAFFFFFFLCVVVTPKVRHSHCADQGSRKLWFKMLLFLCSLL